MTQRGYWRSARDPERVMSLEAVHWQAETVQRREEPLAIEEPLEVRLNSRRLATIMRTPGHDQELALGFLFSESVIKGIEDIQCIQEALDEDGLPLPNVIDVVLRQELSVASWEPFERQFPVSASCGLCGKNSITDLLTICRPLEMLVSEPMVTPAMLYALPERLRAAQAVFAHTGGLHAAGLFTPGGELLLLREDIGRHNAVDKLIGCGLQRGTLTSYSHSVLLVSGRTSFEIIQKALFARIPCIAAISAPSSLAVELAEHSGITLIGFLRERALNVYTHPERVCL